MRTLGTPTVPVLCHLLHTLQVGGAEMLASRMARQLSGPYRVVFACLDELGTLGEKLRGEGFAIEVLGRRDGVDWRCALRLARLLRRERVAVVHAHQYGPLFYAMAARLVTRFPGRGPRIVFTEHGRAFPDYPRRKRMLANRLLLRRRDRIVAVGEAVRQALIRNECMPAGRIEVIYNGIDLSPFASVEDVGSVREEMRVAPEDFVLMQVARLDYLKDHATAIRTLARVVKVCPQARLVLVGEGPELPKVEGLIREHGLGEYVRLLGSRRDVPRLLGAADAFLLSSISEGIPLTVAEAMASGLPVVSTRVGGVPEMIEPGVTGLLAPAGDDGALAEQVIRLIREPDLRARLAEKGRERVHQRFDEVRMMDQYTRVYEEVLGRR